MELGFAFVAALLFLAWLTERRWLLWAAFLLALGLGSGLSLASHQSDDSGWLPSFADWLHLSAATLWIGGLLSPGGGVWRGRDLARTALFRLFAIGGPPGVAPVLAPLADAGVAWWVEGVGGAAGLGTAGRRLVAGADLLVHAAAALPIQASRDSIRSVNVGGTASLLAAAAEAGVRRHVLV